MPSVAVEAPAVPAALGRHFCQPPHQNPPGQPAVATPPRRRCDAGATQVRRRRDAGADPQVLHDIVGRFVGSSCWSRRWTLSKLKKRAR